MCLGSAGLVGSRSQGGEICQYCLEHTLQKYCIRLLNISLAAVPVQCLGSTQFSLVKKKNFRGGFARAMVCQKAVEKTYPTFMCMLFLIFTVHL